MLKKYGSKTLKELSLKAKISERKRAHLNIHERLDANVQKLFIATEPDTYMRPHRHTLKHKWELLIVLKGKIDLLIFNDDGQVIQRIEMSNEKTMVVEVPALTWHCYVSMQEGTLALEVKEGAYCPENDSEFSSWSPVEGSAEASCYLEVLRHAMAK